MQKHNIKKTIDVVAIMNIRIMIFFLNYFFSPQLQLIVLGRCPDNSNVFVKLSRSNASGWGWRAGGGGDRDGVPGGWPEWWTVRASRETMVCMVHLYWLKYKQWGRVASLSSFCFQGWRRSLWQTRRCCLSVQGVSTVLWEASALITALH